MERAKLRESYFKILQLIFDQGPFRLMFFLEGYDHRCYTEMLEHSTIACIIEKQI